MWHYTRQFQVGDRVQHYSLLHDGTPLRYRDVLRYWRDDSNFRSFFNSLLSESELSSYRWETPSITNITADRDFEFVLLDAPGLEQHPDSTSFSSHFPKPGAAQNVVTFANVGRDASLVVPCPMGPPKAYGHLAAFVRHAPAEQIDELWNAVGAAMLSRLGSAPTWLSTAGMGVPWLHVRLDSRPKYYGFAEYRNG